MRSGDNQFEVVTFRFKERVLPFRAESLLEPVLETLRRREILRGYDENDLLLTGVRGTRRLLKDRTHGGRFATYAIRVGDMRNSGDQLRIEEDPFWYAEDSTDRSPAVVFYDGNRLKKVDQSRATYSRYVEEYGEHPDIDVYGVAEGTLDDVTVAAVLLRPE